MQRELLHVHDEDLGVPSRGFLEGEAQHGVHGLPHVGPDRDGAPWSAARADGPYKHDGTLDDTRDRQADRAEQVAGHAAQRP